MRVLLAIAASLCAAACDDGGPSTRTPDGAASDGFLSDRGLQEPDAADANAPSDGTPTALDGMASEDGSAGREDGSARDGAASDAAPSDGGRADADAADGVDATATDATVVDAAPGDAGPPPCLPDDSADGEGCFQTAAIGLVCQRREGWVVLLRLGHGMGGCSWDVLPGIWHLTIPLGPPLAQIYRVPEDVTPTLVWEEPETGASTVAIGGTLTFDEVPANFGPLEMPPNRDWAAGTIDMEFSDGTRVRGRFVADGCARAAFCDDGGPPPEL